MGETMYQCGKCDESISPETDRCAACGYEPARTHRQKKKWYGLVGGLSCCTLFGALWGVPLIYYARKHSKAAKTARPAVEV